MSNHRICRVCWNCGSEEFRKLKPDRMIYFSKDRECSSCGLTYTLPMAGGVKVLLLVVGALFTLGFGTSIIGAGLIGWAAIQAERQESVGTIAFTVIGLFIAVPLTLIGVECLRQGIAGCNQEVTEPTNYSQAGPSTDGQERKLE